MHTLIRCYGCSGWRRKQLEIAQTEHEGNFKQSCLLDNSVISKIIESTSYFAQNILNTNWKHISIYHAQDQLSKPTGICYTNRTIAEALVKHVLVSWQEKTDGKWILCFHTNFIISDIFMRQLLHTTQQPVKGHCLTLH